MQRLLERGGQVVVVAVIVGHEYVPIHFLAIVGRAIGSTVVGTEYGDGVGEQGARLVAGGTQSGAIGQIRVVPSLDRAARVVRLEVVDTFLRVGWNFVVRAVIMVCHQEQVLLLALGGVC